jgi:hypothetical protein
MNTNQTVTKQNNSKYMTTKRKQQLKAKRLKQPFPVSSICRDDFEIIGYDMAKVDDGTMYQIASKMGDHCENDFGATLESLAEEFDLPKHKKQTEPRE